MVVCFAISRHGRRTRGGNISGPDMPIELPIAQKDFSTRKQNGIEKS